MLFILVNILLINTQVFADSGYASAVYINGQALPLAVSWLDTLDSSPESLDIYYKISGAHGNGSAITTQIRLPQILTIQEVAKQILLYYRILDDRNAQMMEEVYVYPYFSAPGQPPPIKARFSDPNTLTIDAAGWETIPKPETPTPEERDIFNQIIEDSFNEIQEYDSVSAATLEKIGRRNKMTAEKIRGIYEKVFLWQFTRKNP